MLAVRFWEDRPIPRNRLKTVAVPAKITPG
jgi:hypothetical protein